MVSFNRWLQASLVLHIVLMTLAILLKSDGDGLSSGGTKSDDKAISPKSIDVSLISPPPSTGMNSLEKPKKSSSKEEKSKSNCKNTYGGIGIVILQESRIITSVPSGWPASRAGLRIGDRIISPSFEKISGPAGTVIEIVYESFDGVHTISLVRENICIGDRENIGE